MIYLKTQHSAEFKLEAAKRAKQSDKTLTKVAEELGVEPTTLQGWVKRPKSQRSKENKNC